MEALSKLQLLVWSKPLPPYNTFIGGAGEFYPTAADLSTAMSIPPEAIQRFTIDNQNNISCRIDRTYFLSSTAFVSGKMKGYLVDLDGRITIGSAGSLANNSFLKLRLHGLTSWNTNMNYDGSPNLVYTPEMLSTGNYSFNYWKGGCNRLFIAKLTSFGSSNFGLFNYTSGSYKNTIYINPSVLASATITDVVSKGAIIRVVSNSDLPNKVTDLSVVEVKPRMVKFNFTTPTAGTNPIDFYEVWIEKIDSYRDERRYLPSDAEITAPNQFATFLDPSTNYKVYLCTVDTMYNGTGMDVNPLRRMISNTVEFTTPALSGYEVGMSAYLKLATDSFDSSGNNAFIKDTSLSYSGGYAKFTNGYIDIPNREVLSFTDGTNDLSMHIAFGFIWNTKTGNQVFLSKASVFNGYEYEYEITKTSTINFTIRTKGSNSDYVGCTIPIASISTGVLNTLQFIYNGNKTTPIFKVILNNVEITNTPVSVGTYAGMSKSVCRLRIGATNQSYIATPTNFLKADMKELAVWKNRTMTPTEITDIDYRIKNNIPLI